MLLMFIFLFAPLMWFGVTAVSDEVIDASSSCIVVVAVTEQGS